ncbi:MAG: hypothetical protein WA785_12160 [Candidatus Acidiferrales bacterium]
MTFGIWDAPSGRFRRWGKRGRGYTRAPMFARMAVVLLAAALVGAVAWQGVQKLLHPARTVGVTTAGGSAGEASSTSGTAAWESEVMDALQDATAQGTAGNITAAEVGVDRAAAIVTAARLQELRAAPDFFDVGIRGLDQVLGTHPENQRLLEHVTQARIELAQLRCAQTGAATAGGPDAPAGLPRGPMDGAIASVPIGPGTKAPHAVAIPGHVVVAAPRAVAAQSVLDATTAKGNCIDATLMPETLEIILPPATRLFVDDVRVEGLTFEGASQTLDGIHWKNVTFIGTRLRYEGGQVSLSNVRFVRCTFGFSTDERGARLASAIALGQTSFVIE